MKKRSDAAALPSYTYVHFVPDDDDAIVVAT